MRLRQLKVSGFKSFADTTVIEFPGPVTGIVGPNGCGKSNIIDAVRWVLGEGRIGELRGQASMSELIFSGSSSRPASSRASVEMVLDNSDGGLAGPWGRYAELSVKRVVTRDGSNAYLINNQHVRRRDVQEIFLGTGLGSRSYAIISQGMISSIIKARPEELRVYLEEAAGVSRYRERRRETESSLAATRDNLQKVALLQDGKKAEAERLEKQAESAARWLELDRARQEAEQLLYFLLEEEAGQAVSRIDAQVALREADFAEKRGEAGRLAAEAESRRVRAREARIAADAAREARFEADRKVLEAQTGVRMAADERRRLSAAVETAEKSLKRKENEAEEARTRQQGFLSESASQAAAAREFEKRASALEERIGEEEPSCQAAREAFEELRRAASEKQSQLGIANAEFEALNREAGDLERRLQVLESERRMTKAPDENRCRELALKIDAGREAVKAAAAEVGSLEAERSEAERLLNESVEEKASLSRLAAGTAARLQALESVQREAESSGQLPEWLSRMGLAGMPRLFERVHAVPGWEVALESALSVRSAAIGVGSMRTAAGFSPDPPPARAVIYAAGAPPRETAAGREGLVPLLSLVGSDDAAAAAALSHWLAGTWAVSDLREAENLRGLLGPGERIVTREGHILDSVSVSYWAEEGAASGLISRSAEIAALREKAAALRGSISAAEETWRQRRSRLAGAAAKLKEKRSFIDSARSESHRFEVEHSRLEAALDAWRRRSERVAGEIEGLRSRLHDRRLACDDADERFSALDRELGEARRAEEKAQLELEDREQSLLDLQEQRRELLSDARLSRARAESLRGRAADAGRAVTAAEAEIARLRAEAEDNRSRLLQVDEASAREGLAAMISGQQAALEAFAAAETAAAAAERESEETRLALDGVVGSQAPLLQEISELKVKRQALATQRDSYTEWLESENADREALRLRSLEEKARPAALKQKVSRLNSGIAALGAVNHAAIEQLEACRRTIAETDRQVKDLGEAIGNLESTIRRIDGETRTLLKSTFEAVNTHFGDVFRGFFGGGSAELKMEGGEILEAGVEVLARPPGKRNSSVRILSGGEQALTATALVFAIFRLNPAPFCLLDEVDAPLDEANQERLARQILAMSSRTQFVMITHHRVTMELLRSLVGVTMNEPGVSRVVAVDVAEAGKIAGS